MGGKYEDVCNPKSETAAPTPETSQSLTLCERRKWHALITEDDFMQCTNGYDIPAGVEMEYYDTVLECCEETFGFGVKCEYDDVCADVTPNPSLFPAVEPTPSPTACEARTWYFNINEQICDNKVRDDNASDAAYGSLEDCCGENFCDIPLPNTEPWSDNSGQAASCPSGAVYDECCEMAYPTWYWNRGQKLCSNEPVNGGAPDDITYGSRSECCRERFGNANTDVCSSVNKCYSAMEPTFSPTLSATFDTLTPTFGSTPTVSKETSGPPTKAAVRGQNRLDKLKGWRREHHMIMVPCLHSNMTLVQFEEVIEYLLAQWVWLQCQRRHQRLLLISIGQRGCL